MEVLPPLVRLNMHEDERGTLVAIEGERDLPFAIERVYYILGKDGSARGFHAHKQLEQLLICPRGACRIVLDDGRERSEYRLAGPEVGLYVGPMTWREMHDFSEGALLLVLASAPHNEGDYIHDYDDFLNAARGSDGR